MWANIAVHNLSNPTSPQIQSQTEARHHAIGEGPSGVLHPCPSTRGRGLEHTTLTKRQYATFRFPIAVAVEGREVCAPFRTWLHHRHALVQRGLWRSFAHQVTNKWKNDSRCASRMGRGEEEGEEREWSQPVYF